MDCLDYVSYVTSQSIEYIKNVLETIPIPTYKLEKYSDKSYLLSKNTKDDVGKLFSLYPHKNGWIVPNYKVSAVRYYLSTGIITEYVDLQPNDKLYFDTLLQRIGKIGLLPGSQKPVNSKELEKIFLKMDIIPTPKAYFLLRNYINSHSQLYPPRTYTEIMEMAGRIKGEDGVLIHDYKHGSGGEVVIVGAISDDKLDELKKKYPNGTVNTYPWDDTTIIEYWKDADFMLD